jgi:hypothetical protein
MASALYEDLLALKELYSKPDTWCKSAYKSTSPSGTDCYCLAGGMMFVAGCTEFTAMSLLEPRVQRMYRAMGFANSCNLLRYNDDGGHCSQAAVRNRIDLYLKRLRKPTKPGPKPKRKPAKDV